MVRIRFGWLASLVTAILLGFLPGVAFGQDPTNQYYPVPPEPYPIPGPFGHPHYEQGGLFATFGMKYMMTSNPMKRQDVAYYGFWDRDASIGLATGLGTGNPGQFLGSKISALNTGQVAGPLSFQPGFDVSLGWRFENGIAVELNWFRLADFRYSASATLQPQPFLDPGQALENTFISSPVFNYSPAFLGPAVQLATNPGPVALGNAGATSGIWNAASVMTIDFVQRIEQYQMLVRYPLQQTDCYRLYATFGPRLVWFWERFKWLTVAQDANGVAGPQDQANYSNVVSNRLWGGFIGLGNEWRFEDGPIGAWAISLDLSAALFADFVNAEAKYELGDLSTGASRRRRFFTLAPEVQASVNLYWYPWQAVQVQMGYDAMAFFNTVSSPNPIDFNVGAIDPGWQTGTLRWLYGLNFSVTFVF